MHRSLGELQHSCSQFLPSPDDWNVRVSVCGAGDHHSLQVPGIFFNECIDLIADS